MKKELKTCILLTSDNEYLSNEAEKFVRSLFHVILVKRFSRNEKVLPDEIYPLVSAKKVDYLFNFLSPIILSQKFLKRIKLASINFHPAPPKWPGVGSASFALFEKDEKFGVTVHHMMERVDSGEIIRVDYFSILKQDTCDSLIERAFFYSLLSFYEVLHEIASTGNITKSKKKWTRKAITREEFDRFMTLSLDDPPEFIRRKIRAIRSKKFSGPFIQFGGFRFELPPNSHNKKHTYE